MRLRRENKQDRIVEGEVRNAAWRKLSPQEQLAEIDRRLGKGVGAKRQRKILAERLGNNG